MLGRSTGKGPDKMASTASLAFSIYYMVEGGKCVLEGLELGRKEIDLFFLHLGVQVFQNKQCEMKETSKGKII